MLKKHGRLFSGVYHSLNFTNYLLSIFVMVYLRHRTNSTHLERGLFTMIGTQGWQAEKCHDPQSAAGVQGTRCCAERRPGSVRTGVQLQSGSQG